MRDGLRAIVIDEFPVVRRGLRRFLEKNLEANVVFEADNVAAAEDAVLRLEPDIVIVQLPIIDDGSVCAARRILASGRPPMLGFGCGMDRKCLEAFRMSGGAGFVSKNASLDDLLAAVKAVVSGERWVQEVEPETLVTYTSSTGPEHTAGWCGGYVDSLITAR